MALQVIDTEPSGQDVAAICIDKIEKVRPIV